MDNLNRWFKPKPYIHFSPKIGKKDFSWMLSYLIDPLKISKHPFFPLIHKTLYKRRFRREPGNIAKLRITLEPKPRHIYYATHIDTHIYSYYADNLSNLYEEKLAANSELNSCVIAYRRIAKKMEKVTNVILTSLTRSLRLLKRIEKSVLH